SRVYEDRWLTEIPREQILRRQTFLRLVVEDIQHVHHQLDASEPVEGDRSRQPHIQERLRRQPPGAAWLEQQAILRILRQRYLRARCPRLAAEVPEVGRQHESSLRH